MSDTASVAIQQRAFWNSEATRRWVTEQARIDRLFTGVSEAALAAAAPKPGESVLEIGCGTGTMLLKLAEAVGPEGQVLGVDISEQQLALARRRIDAAGATQARVTLDDAATHDFPPAAFDLVFTRFGVMFFADPVAAIRHLVTPPAPPGPEDPGQFAWGDPARVRRILDGAGFRDVALKPVDLAFNLGTDAADAAAFATYIGQGARLLQGAPDATVEAARAAFEVFFKAHEGPDGVSMPGGLWLVSAVN